MIGWCLVCDETFTTLDDLEWHNKCVFKEPYCNNHQSRTCECVRARRPA